MADNGAQFFDLMRTSAASPRDQILNVEALIASAPQLELQTDSHFADGLYARTIHIPAGTVLTGKIHLRGHINVVSSGTILVKTESGEREITAPAVIVSEPGTKRVGYAVTDCVWTTVHASDAATADEAEAALVVDNYSEYEILKLGGSNVIC